MGGIFSKPAPPPPAPVAAPAAAKTSESAANIQKRRAEAEGRTLSETTGDLGSGNGATKKLLGE